MHEHTVQSNNMVIKSNLYFDQIFECRYFLLRTINYLNIYGFTT